MKALILEKPGVFKYQSVAGENKLQDHEVLVKVHRVGICGTDYHAYRGRQPFFQYPRILGHELGVEVVAVGNKVSRVKIGDNCSAEPYLNCGHCDPCMRGKGNCCESLQVMGVHIDGGMKEYCIMPENKLHVSNQLTFEQLALVETLGIGAHAVDRAGVIVKDTVLVVGAGPIGLSVMEFARMRGAKIVAADISMQRLDFCQRHHKADAVILLGNDPVSQIKNAFDGVLPTVIFDATGNPSSMMQNFNYAACGGRIVFVGLFSGEIIFDDPHFHRRELTLMATRNSLPENFTHIIRCLEEGKIDTSTWITHRIPFDNIAEEFEKLLSPARMNPARMNLSGWRSDGPDSGVVKAIIALT